MAKDRVYEELDDVKVENEKLRADFISKVELCEHLKKMQNEQVTKNREASSKIDKLTQHLLEKEEETALVKRSNEDLKCSLIEKESIVKHLNAANDKLRAERDEKNRNSEQEIQRLALALDEANELSIDQEQKINVLMAEIEGLKGDLSVSKKCLEAEKNAKNPRELMERDDLLVQVEEEKRKVEDQLKWKKEQFKHLEEAHEKLRNQFKASKKEWEQEKSTLLDEISSLQTRLDSQIRVAGDLQNRLQICNQALAHEETRRKYLEVEVSEFKARYETIYSECQDAESQLDCLNSQRDNEVASLRHILGTKEAFYKEMEYRAGKLEQENLELLTSLKELQEARIQEAGSASSLSKLKNRLRSLEQKHKECSTNLRAKEAEWNSQLEEMTRQLNGYSSQIQRKDAALEVLEIELESCLSSAVQLKLQNEEISVMLLVLKSGMFEAQLKHTIVEADALANARRDSAEERRRTAMLSKRIETLDQLDVKHQLMEKELDRCKETLEESSRCQLHLKEQALQMEKESKEKLREVCDALETTESELTEEREKVASLLRKAESLDLIEGQRLLLQKELESYKEMLEESSRSRVQFEEQALKIENKSKEKHREVCDALETTKSELAEERERTALLMKRVESLDRIEERWLETWEELQRHKEKLKDACRRQCELEEQSVRKKNEFGEKLQEVCDALENANIELTEERERTSTLIKRIESSDHLEEQLALRQKEIEQYKERELKQVRNVSERTCAGYELELEFELWITESIADRLKVDLQDSQALRKELEASLLAQVEIEETINKEKDELVRITEEKDGIIVNLQQQVASLVQELKAREHDMIMEAFVDELKIKNKNLLENNTMLSTDRENLLGFITSLGDRIGELSGEDGKLMGLLGRIVQSDELYGALKENNKSLVSSPVAIKHDPLIEERSPFRELN